MIALVFLFSAVGLACLGLTNPSHFGWMFRRSARRRDRVLLRCLASLSIIAGLKSSLSVWGFSMGMVAWAGVLTVSSIALLVARNSCRS